MQIFTVPAGPAGASGSTDFIGLSDTPGSYAGQAGMALVVNLAETALEFGAGGGGGNHVVSDAAADTAPVAVTVQHESSANTTPGFGVAVQFVLDDGLSAAQLAARQEVIYTDTSPGSPQARMAFGVADGSGSVLEQLVLTPALDVRFPLGQIAFDNRGGVQPNRSASCRAGDYQWRDDLGVAGNTNVSRYVEISKLVQSIPTGVLTPVLFDVEVKDEASLFALPGTSIGPLATNGLWHGTFSGTWSSAVGGSIRTVTVLRALSPTLLAADSSPPSGGVAPSTSCSFIKELDAAQTIVVLAFQDSGAPLDLQNATFTLARVR